METIQEYLQDYNHDLTGRRNIEELDFIFIVSFNGKTFKPDELVFGHWWRLKKIRFDKNQIKDTLTIIGCPMLKGIICVENSLTKFDLGYCSAWNLKEVNLSNNNLTEIIWPRDGLSEMKSLDLSNNQLTDLDFISLLSENLLELRINSNKFPPSDLKIFEHLTDLSILYLNDNLFGGSLEPLKNIQGLEELDVSDTNINDGLEYLTNKKHLRRFFCVPIVKNEARNKSNQLILKLSVSFTERIPTDKGVRVNFRDSLVHYGNARWRERYETELQIERETNQQSAEAMDRFYRQNPPSEDVALTNILQGISNDYLKINLENKQLKEENQRLQKQLEIADKITQIEISPK